MQIPNLYIKPSPISGRGVFTSISILSGSTIELAPVIVLSAVDKETIHRTALHDYYFNWGEDGQAAIALGFGGLYNHASDANADYYMDFEGLTINFFARRDIAAGEEITIDYGDRIWF
ncbi:MAG: SET domain-containing protein [Bacteroidota bacterium]